MIPEEFTLKFSLRILSLTAVFLTAAGAFAQSVPATVEAFVSTEWVAQNKASIVLVDTRSADDYNKGHIPGALSIPRTKFYFSRTQVDGKTIKYDAPTAAELIDILTANGITADTTVVAYDNDTNSYGGRFPWVLRSYGHKKAYVIDGGIDKWKDVDGRALETAAVTPVKAKTPYKVSAVGQLRATKSDVLQALDTANGNALKPGYAIYDIRTPGEYDGTVLYDSSNGARAGHIPNAVFSDYNTFIYTDYVDAKGNTVVSSFQKDHKVQVLKKPADLLKLFESKGLTKDKTIFNYCEGGFRSGVYTLVLNSLGYNKVYNYDGSWNEWSKQDDLYPVSKVAGK